MSSSEPSSLKTPPKTVQVGTDAFDDVADAFPSGVVRVVLERPVRVGLVGGTHEHRMQAMATLTRRGVETVHSFRMPTLLGELRMQTQNALRKSFDHAAEEGAVLFFDDVGALMAHAHADETDDEAEPSVVEYFFDRIDAYRGPVLLGMDGPDDASRAPAFDLVVEC